MHVAGTNGKGSVTLKVAKSLSNLGFKTGMFISPHVNTFRERIQIDNEYIDKESVVEKCHRIFEMVDKHKLQLRYFEVLTMLALLEYKEKKCQYAVLECGIGGHLDSTNIVD